MHWRLAFDGTWHLCKFGRVGPTGETQTACGRGGRELSPVTMTGLPRRGRVCPTCQATHDAHVKDTGGRGEPSGRRTRRIAGLPARVGVILEALEDLHEAQELLADAVRNRRTLDRGSSQRKLQQADSAVGKAKRRLEQVEQRVNSVKKKSRALAVVEAEQICAAEKAAIRQATARRSSRTPVEVRSMEPRADAGTKCRGCGRQSQLRAKGMCGACLKRLRLLPCARCGLWVPDRQLKWHDCGPTKVSVRAVSGGSPTLGRRR